MMYLDKIYEILNHELKILKNAYSLDEEISYELNLIDIESIEIYKYLITENYQVKLNVKYKEVYDKVFKNICNIKNNNDNSIMFDYLSEIYNNILDYSKMVGELYYEDKKF